MDGEEQRMLTLVSADEKSSQLLVEAAMESSLLRETLDDTEDGVPEFIHLTKIDGATLELVVAYLKSIMGIPCQKLRFHCRGERSMRRVQVQDLFLCCRAAFPWIDVGESVSSICYFFCNLVCVNKIQGAIYFLPLTIFVRSKTAQN